MLSSYVECAEEPVGGSGPGESFRNGRSFPLPLNSRPLPCQGSDLPLIYRPTGPAEAEPAISPFPLAPGASGVQELVPPPGAERGVRVPWSGKRGSKGRPALGAPHSLALVPFRLPVSVERIHRPGGRVRQLAGARSGSSARRDARTNSSARPYPLHAQSEPPRPPCRPDRGLCSGTTRPPCPDGTRSAERTNVRRQGRVGHSRRADR